MNAKSRFTAPRRILHLARGPIFLLALAAAIVLLPAAGAWACPGCKDALAANDGDGGNLVAGYFWSILFMMSIPFTILGTFSGSMYLAVRRARAQQFWPQQSVARQPQLPAQPGRNSATAGAQRLVEA